MHLLYHRPQWLASSFVIRNTEKLLSLVSCSTSLKVPYTAVVVGVEETNANGDHAVPLTVIEDAISFSYTNRLERRCYR